MASPRLSDEVLNKVAEVYKKFGESSGARYLNVSREMFQHRVRVCFERGLLTERVHIYKKPRPEIDGRLQLDITDGTILVGSDAHYHPGIISTAHRAFVELCKTVKPTAVVMNGDAFDGSSISRYPRIGWDNKPTVKQELDAVEERLTEIEDACGTRQLFWPLGNHDARYETFLAQNAPQYEGVDGFSLKHKFPLWRPCWSLFVNDDVVIKHRYKSGIHAPHNNTQWAGRTMVTGHLHSLKVQPMSDYNGTRFGVDTGTLAAPYGPQFTDYCEDSPVNWRSGFVLLTFHKGRLLWPQVCHVLDESEGLVELGTHVFTV